MARPRALPQNDNSAHPSPRPATPGGRLATPVYTRRVSTPVPEALRERIRDLGRRAKAASRRLATASTAEKDGALHAARRCCSSGRPRSSRPTTPTSRPPRAAGMDAGPLDRLRLTDARLEAWHGACARSPPCPIRSARCSTAGAAPTASRSAGSGCRSGSSRSSTRTGPTSRATPPGSASSPATRRCCGVRRRRCARTGPSPRRCAHGAREARSPGRRGHPRRGHRARDRDRGHAAHRLRRLPDPAGWPALIQSIRDNATVPVIIDGDGNCHVYVDAAADLDEALEIVVNAEDATAERVQRGRVAGRARGRRRRVRARASPTRCTRTASSSSATTDAPPALAGHRRRDRRRLRPRVPRARRCRSRSSADLDAAIAHVNRYGTGPHRGDPDARPRRGRAASPHEVDAGGRRRERVDALHRRRRVRLRCRDRYLDAEAARARPDGPARADHVQVRRLG